MIKSLYGFMLDPSAINYKNVKPDRREHANETRLQYSTTLIEKALPSLNP
jgi:hypothetical protein